MRFDYCFSVVHLCLLLFITLLYCGCGSGGSSFPSIPALNLRSDAEFRLLRLSWDAFPETSYYRVSEAPTGSTSYTLVSSYVTDLTYTFNIRAHQYEWEQSQFRVEACTGGNIVIETSDPVTFPQLHSALATGYFKASNTNAGDRFGQALSASDDGNTLIVSAYCEESNATGVNGLQSDNSASRAGAVYVFNQTASEWSQQAYLKASNTEATDCFGWSVALSGDGNTLAVGAYNEDSAATGIDGSEADNSASDAGAVYVFTRVGNVWTQQAYIKASNTEAADFFGYSCSLSDDGDTLLVSAPLEDSGAMGVGGNEGDNTASASGAAYVFTRAGTVWTQEAYIKASNTGAADFFGFCVALSGDGSTLAIGSNEEDSSATGIGGNQADNSADRSGAVYVFTKSGATWSQQAYVKASNTDALDYFGRALTLSDDGNTMVVGSHAEDSAATVINGDETDNSASSSGAAYVFTRSGSSWSQQAYLKAPNAQENDQFGDVLALSDDGNTLIVAATFEDSNAVGINGDQANNDAPSSGCAYLLVRTGTTWRHETYIKAANTEQSDRLGWSATVNEDASLIALSSVFESSNSAGLNGNQSDNSANAAGAVFVY